VSNDDLVARGIETSDEWIADRTGIRFRRTSPPTTKNQRSCTASLPPRTRGRRTQKPQDIDLIIVATSTPDMVFPSTACILQNKLGNHGGRLRRAGGLQRLCLCADHRRQIHPLRLAQVRAGGGRKSFRASLTGRIAAPACCSATAPAPSCSKPDEPGILSSALHADGRYHDILSVPGQVSGGTVIGDPCCRWTDRRCSSSPCACWRCGARTDGRRRHDR
jgi:3-oxoacyl-[acyl-carrier-protein] synthase-3